MGVHNRPDRNIPRSRAPAAMPPRLGVFVRRGDVIALTDLDGNEWSVDRVIIASGGFGFREDGASILPQPTVCSDDGQVLIEGDKVVIDFLDGNPKMPLVRGVANAAGRIADLPNRLTASAKVERKAVVLLVRNDQGAITGKLRIVAHDDGPGFLLESSGAVDLTVVDTNGNKRVGLHIGDAELTVDAGGTSRSLADTRALDRLSGIVSMLSTSTNWLPAVVGNPPTLNPGVLTDLATDIAALSAHSDATTVLKAQ